MEALNQVENALKNVYLDVIRHQLNTSDAFIAKIEKTPNDVWGKEIIVNVATKEEAGEYLNIISEIKNLALTIEISDKAIRVAQNSIGAFVDLLNAEMENMLKEGQQRSINSVYNEDIRPEYLPKEILYRPWTLNSLKDLFDTDKETLYSLNRKKWNFNPQVKIINEFNSTEIEEIIDNINPKVNFMICSPKTKRTFIEQQKLKRQSVDRIKCNDGLYYTTFNENNVVIIPYKFMADNEIWLVDSNDFKIHQLCDWEWLTDEEDKILRKHPTKPIYSATLVKYCDLLCHKPQNQIKIIIKS